MQEAWNNHDWIAEVFLAPQKSLQIEFPFQISVWHWNDEAFAQATFPNQTTSDFNCNWRLMENRSRAIASLKAARRLITLWVLEVDGISWEFRRKFHGKQHILSTRTKWFSPTQPLTQTFHFPKAFIIAIICFVLLTFSALFCCKVFSPHKKFPRSVSVSFSPFFRLLRDEKPQRAVFVAKHIKQIIEWTI